MAENHLANQGDKWGGVRPGAGRPSDALKHKFQEILQSSNAYDRLKRIMQRNPDDEVFLKALQIVLERAYGKPTQAIAMTDSNGIDLSFILNLAVQVRDERGLDA